MTRGLLIFALLAALGLGGLSWHLQSRNARLSAALSAAEAQVASYARTAEIHAAHIKRMAAEAEAWAAIDHDLKSMEGRDAPLSDHLRRAAGRLWP